MKEFKCPHCGGPIIAPGDWQQPATFQSTANPFSGASFPLSGEWQKVTPVGKLEIMDVATRVLDASLSFGFVSVAVGGLIWLSGGPVWSGAPVGFVVGLIRYYYGIGETEKRLTIVEKWKNEDVKPPQAEQKKHVFRAELKDAGGNEQWDEWGVKSPTDWQSYAKSLLSETTTFSERSAGKFKIPPDEFNTMRDKFLLHNWAKWRHPNETRLGVEITSKGRAVLKAIITTPLPHE